MENERCIICSSSAHKPYFEVLKRCVDCGHVIADVNTSLISFEDIYNMDYFKGKGYYDYLRDKDCYEKNFKIRLKTLRRYCPSGNLLEIGSALGFFLNMARQYFSAVGYEICKEATDYACEEFGLDVRSSNFLEDNLTGASFDAVVMWDTIEHLPNPQDFLDKIHFVLKNGGILILTTGDISSAFALSRRKKWRLIHPPLHIHYFSKETITRLLNIYNFKVIDISYVGYWRSIRQISYNLFVSGSNYKKSIFKLVNSIPLSNINVYLNLFDIMQVVSRK